MDVDDLTDYCIDVTSKMYVVANANVLPFASKVFFGAFTGALIILSVAGNLLVGLAILTNARLRRNNENMLTVSLALADLLVAVIVMTFASANRLMGYWHFGYTLCNIWIGFDVMCCTASILNLCAISVDKFLHIKDPMRYIGSMKTVVVYTSIATVWILAVLVSFLPISLGLHRPPQHDQKICSPQTTERPSCKIDFTPTYAIVSSSISFIIPCIFMVIAYIKLFLFAERHAKEIKSMNLHAQVKEKNEKCKRTNFPHWCHICNRKAALTIGVIVGVFLICWVPFFILNITAAFCKKCVPSAVFEIFTWLSYSNSAFNPMIYAVFHSEVRETIRRMLTAHANPLCICCSWCNQIQDACGVTSVACGPTCMFTPCAAHEQEAEVDSKSDCYPVQSSSEKINSSEQSVHSEQDVEQNIHV